MPPNTARFNSAMRLFLRAVQGGLGFKGVHKALELLSLMQACGVAPNIRTYNTFISICAASGAQGSTVAIDYGVRVVKLMGRMGITPGMKPSLRLLTAVASLDSPGKEAPNNVQTAITFLKTMRSAGLELDRRPFEVLVSACSKHGAAEAAMDSAAKVISLMQEWGIETELTAFTAAIQVRFPSFSHAYICMRSIHRRARVADQLDAFAAVLGGKVGAGLYSFFAWTRPHPYTLAKQIAPPLPFSDARRMPDGFGAFYAGLRPFGGNGRDGRPGPGTGDSEPDRGVWFAAGSRDLQRLPPHVCAGSVGREPWREVWAGESVADGGGA